MLVQDYLRSGKTLEDLKNEYGIEATPATELGLPIVRLNYSQINSDKTKEIVRECRALTLEAGTWDVVSRSFTRFFNAGEAAMESQFDWDSFIAEEKCDGSLMTLFYYKGRWLVTTRGSFAQGQVTEGVNLTWEEAFYECVDEISLDYQSREYTYSFEYCGPYNKIVRRYDKPCLFLLTAFHNKSGREMSDIILDQIAIDLRVKRPERMYFKNLKEVEEHLEERSKTDPTYEGLVLRDRNKMRLKVKSATYVALHRLHGNGNIFAAKNLVPLLLKNEQEEVLSYFPEVTESLYNAVETMGAAKARMEAVWQHARGFATQKEFAIYINKHTKMAPVLFLARQQQVEPDAVWRQSEDLILKKLFPKGNKQERMVA